MYVPGTPSAMGHSKKLISRVLSGKILVGKSPETDVKQSITKREGEPSIYCHNCGELGHINKNCSHPTTSYGIILFYPTQDISVMEENPMLNSCQQGLVSEALLENKSNGKEKCSASSDSGSYSSLGAPEINYLLIMDRHTPDFAQIIIGNYELDDLDYLRTLVGRLTQTEAQLILTYDLRYLFTRYWSFSNRDAVRMYQKQFNRSEKLFNRLKKGIPDRGYGGRSGEYVTWKTLLDAAEPHWLDSDWGFPKGRRKRRAMESDIDCAKREFYEETGITDDQYNILHDLEPIEEKIMGSNGVPYRTIYYIGEARTYLPLYSNPFNLGQQSEVTKIGWYTCEQAYNLMRPYQESRLHILQRVHKYLGNLYT